MFSFKRKKGGDFSKTLQCFANMKSTFDRYDFGRYGREGVAALAAATPKDSGKTATSWSYEVVKKEGSVSIIFNNSNIVDGVSIAIILRYGHGTNNGGYVQGRNYISPAIRPVFDRIADSAWREVNKT